MRDEHFSNHMVGKACDFITKSKLVVVSTSPVFLFSVAVSLFAFSKFDFENRTFNMFTDFNETD